MNERKGGLPEKLQALCPCCGRMLFKAGLGSVVETKCQTCGADLLIDVNTGSISLHILKTKAACAPQ